MQGMSACQSSDTHVKGTLCESRLSGHTRRRELLIVRVQAVVNLEMLTKNTADEVSVASYCHKAFVQLGRLLVEALSAGGTTAIAPLLVLAQEQLETEKEAEQYRLHLNCKFTSQFQSVTALAVLQNRNTQLESKLLEMLALRARKELNTITEDPPVATLLAHEIEALLAGSPVQPGALAGLQALKSECLQALTSLSQTIATKEQLTWAELMRLNTLIPDSQLLFWAQRLSQATAMLSHSITRLERHFEPQPLDATEGHSPLSYVQLLKSKQKKLPHTHTVQRLQRSSRAELWEKEALSLVTEKDFFNFALCVEAMIDQLSGKLDEWNQNDRNRGLKQKARALVIENFHYTDSLRRTLQELGESLEDACACADKLLAYCKANQISALELMDDEIWSLFPRINRENMKQARLKVRHTDPAFPLSVVHSDWITQVTAMALPQNS